MPEPEIGETEKDFLKRCIPDLIHEGREQRQAIAICYSIYRKKGTGEKSPKPIKQSPKPIKQSPKPIKQSPKPIKQSYKPIKKNLSRKDKATLFLAHY